MLRKSRFGKRTLRIAMRVSERKSEKLGRKVSRLKLRRGDRDRDFSENKNKHLKILFN